MAPPRLLLLLHERSSLLLLLVSQYAAAAASSASSLLQGLPPGGWARGIVFGGDEWTVPTTQYGSPSSASSLQALAATGATHVRLLTTAYVDSINSTSIYDIAPPSPLASTPFAVLGAEIDAAHALGLRVFLCPVLDLNWDLPWNGHSTDFPSYPSNVSGVSRQLLGRFFAGSGGGGGGGGGGDAQWDAFFASYAAWVLPLANLATSKNVSWFGLASDLEWAFATQEARWRALVASVRTRFAGSLLIEASAPSLSAVAWWDALDAIGVDVYLPLGSNLTLGVAPSVEELVRAWEPIVANMSAAAAAWKLPLVITEVGYQSRPSCHVRPRGTQPRNLGDDSPWLQTRDMSCQANAYEAFLRAWVGAPGLGNKPAVPAFAGVFWWLWRGDPTSGGSSDSDFTPHGKPAEVVLRRY